MRDSEFKRAYLNIIKEGRGDMTMGEEVPPQEVTPEETATGSAKRICFTTSNEELIDLLRREPGFVEVVFFVPEKDDQGKGAIDLEGDKVINYVYKLLETCTDDIRDYINRNKITDEYSRV